MSEVARVENQRQTVPLRSGGIDVEALMMRAIDQGVPVETLERLLAMRTAIKAEHAKEAYYEALGAFQSACPAIPKERIVKGKNGDVRYRYASLDDIVSAVSPHLKEYGLSYTIKTEQKDNFIIATCIVNHISGHSESSTFPVPIDSDSFMNKAQQAGSAMTYAKRYAFCNAFGIMTTDEDDDAQAMGGISPQDIYRRALAHGNALRKWWQSIEAIRGSLSVNDYESAAEAMSEIPREDQKALWLATTKGGIYTTEEREKMRSTEWLEAWKPYAKDNAGLDDDGEEAS